MARILARLEGGGASGGGAVATELLLALAEVEDEGVSGRSGTGPFMGWCWAVGWAGHTGERGEGHWVGPEGFCAFFFCLFSFSFSVFVFCFVSCISFLFLIYFK